jgi:predicted Fe-S protein YdhL (DUF1289 family)
MPATPVPSPCVDVCTLDADTGLCSGCLRNLDEIAAWSVLDDRQKRAVWKLIGQRRRALASAGAGRPAGNGEPRGEEAPPA